MTALAALLGNVFIIIGAAFLSFYPPSGEIAHGTTSEANIQRAQIENRIAQFRLREGEENVNCGESGDCTKEQNERSLEKSRITAAIGRVGSYLHRVQLENQNSQRNLRQEEQITCGESEDCTTNKEENMQLTSMKAALERARSYLQRVASRSRGGTGQLGQEELETCEEMQSQHDGFVCVDDPEDPEKCDCSAPASDKEEGDDPVERMAPVLQRVHVPSYGYGRLRVSYRPRLSWSCSSDACNNYCLTKFNGQGSGECRSSVCVCIQSKQPSLQLAGKTYTPYTDRNPSDSMEANAYLRRGHIENRGSQGRLRQNEDEPATCQKMQEDHPEFTCADEADDSDKCDCSAEIEDSSENEEEHGEQNINVERMAPVLKRRVACQTDLCKNYCLTKFGYNDAAACNGIVCNCVQSKSRYPFRVG